MPLFSIITVCYNAKTTISNTINSVLNQSFTDFEYIIVDGGSTDGTLDIVNPYAEQRKLGLISESDDGIYDAMNKGIQLANGKYLNFLNADDTLCDESVLMSVADQIHNMPNKQIYYGNLLYRNRDGNIDQYFRPNQDIRNFLRDNCITQQALFYDKEVFSVVGKFNSRIRIVGDYEWLLRAVFRKKITSYYMNVNISNFTIGGVSTGRMYKRIHNKEREKLYLVYFPVKYIRRKISNLRRWGKKLLCLQ
ncbi:glycosyltransferase family 2 protein [Sediminispirochaeta smaragdinae]|uniref:Glycosyl transferase family 2 n=1 Tax=Sediminispirochaeta smaragdinae (strain DSM 11293 / JCM 15392 / SEBR 4228) TaxID=573413 RepID=E1RA15_SEDSS|nr:glycosyltransferase family 2 protein [Sediminispirochaeta smaragdinae]ADK83334.1 glycosyl transferase family 2 [Sediminispirochaeta smaragdinae DSM 11293]